MKKQCSICGRAYDTFAFKHGYVCETCIEYLKETFLPDSRVRDDR